MGKVAESVTRATAVALALACSSTSRNTVTDREPDAAVGAGGQAGAGGAVGAAGSSATADTGAGRAGSGNGGRGGNGGATDGGCNPSACSGCPPASPFPCCTATGSCGCTWAPGTTCGSGGSGGSGGGGGAAGGGDAATAGTGGASGTASACPSTLKLCGGLCIPPRPENGCSPIDGNCNPCPTPPANSNATCTLNSCDFTCMTGYRKTASGMGCESTAGAGGAGATDAGCNGNACTNSCSIAAPFRCCHSDGGCGCSWFSTSYCN
jgi:hypothetical protein